MITDRIELLKSKLFENKREVSLVRALLYTESYKKTVGLATIIRRAKATVHILDNVEISIRAEELIVGNRTSKPRSGIISPEIDPYWIKDELDTLESRPQDPLSLGGFDKYMYPFYNNDLKKGITEESLRESLTCLWIKTNDVVLIRSSNSAKY